MDPPREITRRNLRLRGRGGRAAAPAGLAGLSPGFIPGEGGPGLPQSCPDTPGALPALGIAHPGDLEQHPGRSPAWSENFPPPEENSAKSRCLFPARIPQNPRVCFQPRLWKPQGGPIINKSCRDEAPILMGLVLMVLFLKAI